MNRDRELSLLAKSAADARRGTGGITVVEGAPGTGKTVLLEELVDICDHRGLRVVRARGSELDRDLPWGIVGQLFEPFADQGALVPDEALPALRMTATTADYAVLHGLYRLAVRLATGTPLTIIVDDVHWADAQSLRWLAYLALRMERQPMSMVLTIGAGERCADASYGEVITQPGCRRIQLGALGLAEVNELAARVFGASVSQEMVEACLRVTDGNPLLTRLLLDALAESGISSALGVAEVGSVVRTEVVIARLRRQPPAVVTVAQCLAMLGNDPHPAIVAELSGLGQLEVDDAVRTLTRIGMLDGAVFSDPAIRPAVLEDVPARLRADVHLSAARLLRRHGASDLRIAEQLLETAPGNDVWAGDVLDRAARDAVSRGDSELAARLLWRALREPLADSSRLPRALRLLGTAELVGGLPGATAHLREALETSVDLNEQAETAIPLAFALHADGAASELTEVLRQSIERLGDDQPELRLRLQAQSVVHAFCWPEAVAPVPGYAAGYVPSGDEHAQAAFTLYAAATNAINADRAVALNDHLLVEQPELVSERMLPFFAGAATLMLADRLDAAILLLDKVILHEHRVHAPVLRALGYVFRANAYRRAGDLPAACADAEIAAEYLRADDRWSVITPALVALQSDLLLEDKRFDEADLLLQQEFSEGARRCWTWGHLLAARGRAWNSRGDARAALAAFEAAGRHVAAWPFHNPAMLAWRSGAALACAALGDGERARRLAAEELALAREWGAPRSLGIALRAAGRVHSGATGRALLEEAVTVLRASPIRLELARTLTDLGVVMRRHGDNPAARAHLREALDLAQKCGATALSTRAYAELVATGARPRRLRQTGPTALTPTEHQVASLAAKGQSNREIARTLLVTQRAVEGMLTGAYRKLGISGRLQLPEVLDVR